MGKLSDIPLVVHRRQTEQQTNRFTMADQNKEAAKAKAEQEYMERLAKEFSSLPDREVPQGGSSGGSRTFPASLLPLDCIDG